MHVYNLRNPLQVLRQQVPDKLGKVSAVRDRVKQVTTLYSVINVVPGSVATCVAGLSAVQEAFATGNWVSTCGIARVLALGGTMVIRTY